MQAVVSLVSGEDLSPGEVRRLIQESPESVRMMSRPKSCTSLRSGRILPSNLSVLTQLPWQKQRGLSPHPQVHDAGRTWRKANWERCRVLPLSTSFLKGLWFTPCLPGYSVFRGIPSIRKLKKPVWSWHVVVLCGLTRIAWSADKEGRQHVPHAFRPLPHVIPASL